ncbi:MAG TPA: secretin N-terminal domain-containing protein [Tepidisphaeraceae bacterium]|nr:secretin N-terminal domain-containing protein [Tepidisphaeraceae bacterium]
MNFKDAPLEVVLDHLCEAAGLIVVKEGQLDGRVTVESTEPLTPEEAVTLLNTVLKANGFNAVQNGRIVRIVPREKAKKGSVPVHVGSDPAAIAASDDMITQVIPLANVDALKLRQDLTPLIASDADVTANEASNSIVITDSSANIRRLVQIINALDMGQAASTELRVIHLKFADAQETAKLISSMFHAPGEPAGGANAQQMLQMMQQQQQGGVMPRGREGRIPGGAIDQALRGGHVRADADPRTNTLLLTAPAATLKVIEDIVKELDSNPVPASQMKAFRLNFADAEATTKVLSKLYGSSDGGGFPFFNPFGNMGESSAKVKVNITADERTNSVIVSASAEAIKAIGDLINDLDSSPGTGSEIRTFQLKFADAFDTAKMIKSIFEPEDKDANNNSGFRFIFFGPAPPSSKGAKVTATSDDRTNTLVVTGPKESMKVVEDLVTKLDSNATSEDSLFIYRLRNAQAANLETVLNTLFGNTNSQNQNNNGQAVGPNGQPLQQQQQNQQGNGGRGSAGSNGSGTLAGGTGIGARHGQRNGGGFGQHTGPRLPGNLTAAVNEMSGQVFIVADVDTNSLIVTTASKFKDSVRDIIKELDRPAAQVLIKVLVAEVTHDNSADWGLDFSILNTRPSGNGQTAANTLGNAAAAMANGGLVVSVLESNLNLTLHALAIEGKLDVLSRPYILASDNQLATITVGQEVPFITNTQITDTGQQINTIQYQDIGIILNVTPHINPEGLVILDVAPEISQLTGTTVPISAGVAAPIIAKRSAESRVGIKDGETIVIGGLMQDSKTSTISKIPLLGDIPIVGEVFRRTQISKSKTELLIFLTPHVALQPGSLGAISQDEMKSTTLTPRAVAPGVFQEHIRGMRRGAIPQTQPDDSATTQPVKPIRGGEDNGQNVKSDSRAR